MSWTFFVAGAVLSWESMDRCSLTGRCAWAVRSRRCCASASPLPGRRCCVPVGARLPAARADSPASTRAATTAATVAGILGRGRRRLHHLALKRRDRRSTCMPSRLGGAPVINVIYTMIVHLPVNRRRSHDVVPRPGLRVDRRRHGAVFPSAGVEQTGRVLRSQTSLGLEDPGSSNSVAHENHSSSSSRSRAPWSSAPSSRSSRRPPRTRDADSSKRCQPVRLSLRRHRKTSRKRR